MRPRVIFTGVFSNHKVTFIECLLHTRLCSKCTIFINAFSPHGNISLSDIWVHPVRSFLLSVSLGRIRGPEHKDPLCSSPLHSKLLACDPAHRHICFSKWLLVNTFLVKSLKSFPAVYLPLDNKIAQFENCQWKCCVCWGRERALPGLKQGRNLIHWWASRSSLWQ